MRLLPAALLLVALVLPGTAAAASPGNIAALQPLVGEEHHYRIDFLAFRDLAEGGLKFQAEAQPGRYRAELEARTLGVAAWLTGERTQRYVAVMEKTGDGSLRTVSYQSMVLRRKDGEWHNRGKRYRFDYRAGKVYYEKGEGEKFRTVREYPLPAGQPPVDILTGFYNLRLGTYGTLVPGAHLQIPTFTTKGISVIDVEVVAEPARSTLTAFPTNGILVKIKVDPEVFETGDSNLYALLDDNGRPIQGIVENVIGLGDVHGSLRTAAHSSGPHPEAAVN